MAIRLVFHKLLILAAVCLFLSPASAREDWDERQVSVVMRMIGHEILLNSGDSTSRVLPIKREGEQYKIFFEKEFAFQPGDMVASIHRVIEETHLTRNYQVEVVSCDSGAVIYSYLVGDESNMDLIPCRGRDQPAGCYQVHFTPMDGRSYRSAFEIAQSSLEDGPALESQQGITGNMAFLLLSLVSLVALIGYVWKRGQKTSTDSELISIGSYSFNPRSMELSHKKETVELSSKEADLLSMLHSSANQTLEREQILKQVWGDDGDYVGRTLDVFISKLRKRLEADPRVKIVNVRGVGYKLVFENE